MRLKIFSLCLILFFFFPVHVKAQVVINEFSSASDPEWVELYNPTDQIISLSGYTIHFDSNLDIQKYQFCDTDQITGETFRLVKLTSNYLLNSGDKITLRKNGVTQDEISYGSGQTIPELTGTQSGKRDPVGGANWVVSDSPSQDGSQVSFDCPTPTPTVTPVPTTPPQTATPTSTATPTITPLPTATKTATPKPSPTPKISSTVLPSMDPSVLAAGAEEVLPTPTILAETVTSGSAKKKEVPLGAAIFLVVGVVAFILAGISFAKIQKGDVTKDQTVTP